MIDTSTKTFKRDFCKLKKYYLPRQYFLVNTQYLKPFYLLVAKFNYLAHFRFSTEWTFISNQKVLKRLSSKSYKPPNRFSTASSRTKFSEMNTMSGFQKNLDLQLPLLQMGKLGIIMQNFLGMAIDVIYGYGAHKYGKILMSDLRLTILYSSLESP